LYAEVYDIWCRVGKLLEPLSGDVTWSCRYVTQSTRRASGTSQYTPRN